MLLVFSQLLICPLTVVLRQPELNKRALHVLFTCSLRARLFSRSNRVSKIVPAVKFHTGDEPALHRS